VRHNLRVTDFPSTVGPLALVGSGEFSPVMIDVDRHLLHGRRQRVAFLPTAAGEEGDASVNHWLKLGTDHYNAMGVEPVPVAVLTRDDANNPALANLIADVGMVYLSGGNPGYIAKTLRHTLVWEAIMAAWQSGSALAGCSAGAMTLTARAVDRRAGAPESMEEAMNVVPHLNVVPHFDQMAKWDPGFLNRAQRYTDAHQTLIGVDEDTALVGGPHDWTVMGRLTVSVFGPDGPKAYAAGERIVLP
jgi:cyanophycinase